MKERKRVMMVAMLGGLLHALVAFPNHFLFRTYALDLGLYTHTTWRYLYGPTPDTAMFQAIPVHILADHFDLYLLLLSPLTLLFGTWTLPVVQWCALVLGGFGVRRFLITRGLGADAALAGMALLLLFFGAFAASSFDYHSNVVAAMWLPWCLDALWRARYLRAAGLFMLMLVAKENIGLWLGVVMAVVAMARELPGRSRRWAGLFAGIGFAWSAVIIGLVMPSLAGDGTYAHFDYRLLSGVFAGEHPPLDLLRGLFVDVLHGTVKGNAVRMEFWTLLLLSGGWALLLRPAWGLMALPIAAQKMWHDDPAKWAVFAQYSIEFAPLIAIAIPLVVQGIGRAGLRRWCLGFAPVMALGCTIRTMDGAVAHIDRSRIRFYKVAHYARSYDTDTVRQVIASLPGDLAVSAQSPAVPHLALRERVYQFPLIHDAEVVLLMPLEEPYPMEAAAYRRCMDSLAADPGWRVEVDASEVRLLRRRRGTP